MSDSNSNPGKDSGPKKLAEILAELKAEYLAKFPEKIAKLKSLTAAQNWPGLEEEYHNLKGTGKTYGYPEISALCEKLEKLSQNPSTQSPQLFQQAIVLLEQIFDFYSRGETVDLVTNDIFQEISKSKFNFSLKPGES